MHRRCLLVAIAIVAVLAGLGVRLALAQARVTPARGSAPTSFIDNAAFPSPIIQMDHNSAVANSYGINILNRPDNASAPTVGTGAQTALAIHQYSDSSPALQIDNTRAHAFILLKEATNAVNSAGTQGTGDFLELWGYTTGSPSTNLQIGRLNNLLAFVSNDSSRPFQFVTAAGNTGPALQVAQTNAGTGLNINQAGAGAAISVSQSGAAHSVQITPSVGADGFYPILVNGRTNGAALTTSQNGAGQNVLALTKNGTGAGDALLVVNKGTDKSIRVQNTTLDVFSVDPNGGVIVGNGGSTVSKIVRGTATWAPGAIGAGAQATTTVTVTGAATGGACIAGPVSPAPLTGYPVQCIVTATNTCSLSILNQGAGASPTLASATFYCLVFNP